MSILNIIKLRLGLGPAAENHHWDGSVPNQLSLRRGTPEAPGTEVLKVVDGKVDFSIGILGFEVGSNANGTWFKFPSWLANFMVMWGTFAFTYNTTVQTHTWSFPRQFSASPQSIITRTGGLATANAVTYDQVMNSNYLQGSISFVASSGSVSLGVTWLALGVAA